MLRSAATSRFGRTLGYAAAVVCVGLYLYVFVALVLAAVGVDGVGPTLWILGVALVSLGLVALATVRGSKRRQPSGYVLVAVVSVIAAVASLVTVAPVLIFAG